MQQDVFFYIKWFHWILSELISHTEQDFLKK
jgi:hypothetical protein